MKRIILAAVLIAMCSVSGHAQTYADQAVLAADAAFISRVRIAIVQYAINDVSVESDATNFHTQRVALAKRVVQNPELWSKIIAVGVVADMSFTSTVSDGAIFSRVTFIWNTYLGNPGS